MLLTKTVKTQLTEDFINCIIRRICYNLDIIFGSKYWKIRALTNGFFNTIDNSIVLAVKKSIQKVLDLAIFLLFLFKHYTLILPLLTLLLLQI